ncbi:hypothetical protein HED60_22120 [Planctomycetales bacterium ZRK34]|nr:hypothetical protein HED60_22120 [Planctomycetales bacterium ZRK34]
MSERFEQLEVLIADLLDDRLDAAGRQQLQSMLSDDAEARRHYAEFIATQSMIRRVVHRQTQSSVFKLQSKPTAPTSPMTSLRVVGVLSAAAMIALMLTAWFVFKPTSQPLPSGPSNMSVIAMLSDISDDVVFDQANQPMTQGANLSAGTLRLQSGTAQVLFTSGALVDLTGPCEFRMIDDRRGMLNQGILEADVPPSAHGFTIESPTATVIDLGTRFNMNLLTDGQLRVRCSQGHISVVPHLADNASESISLTTGRQVTIDPRRSRIVAGAFAVDGIRLTIDHALPYNTSGVADSPEDEEAFHAVDNDFTTKYLNINRNGAGLVVDPANGLSVVRGLTLTAAADHPERDPASFLLKGSNDGGATWTDIARGSIPGFIARGAAQAIEFDNDRLFASYCLIFPTVSDPAAANSVQIAEVEFVADQVLSDVTHPGQRIEAYNITGEPKPNAPYESADRTIDNDPATKYLNFNKAGAGLTIRLDAPAAVRGVGLCTANDDPQRDPAAFTLQGSDDGIHFVDIVTDMPVPAIADRHYQRHFIVDNDTAYRHYRLIFTGVADNAAANSVQIAEIQLFAATASSPEAGPE